MTNRGMTGDEYIAQFPREAARWMNTCAACGRKGYRPELPEVITRGTIETALADNLRALFKPLSVNEHGLCQTCAETLRVSTDT